MLTVSKLKDLESIVFDSPNLNSDVEEDIVVRVALIKQLDGINSDNLNLKCKFDSKKEG